MPDKKPITPLAQVLTEYLQAHNMTQPDLADKLNWSDRTLRRYKNGEDVLTDIRELKRVADLLEVSPERLGILPQHVPYTPDQIDPAIAHVWKLTKAAKFYEADVVVDRLIRDITGFIHTEDPIILRKLSSALHVAGYVKGQTSRDPSRAYYHYHEMEQIARILGDQTLINIALTYQGDMLQRWGRVEEGIQYLEAARDTTPQADKAAKGNGIQLLGRAYFKAQRIADFDRCIQEAEALAYDVDAVSSTRGQFTPGTVYEEWGRSLGLQGHTTTALDYIDKADKLFSQDWNRKRSDMLVKTAKAMILVYGKDIKQGVQLAVESVRLCKESGNVRLLERLYGVQQYVDRLARETGDQASVLKDALMGPVEY